MAKICLKLFLLTCEVSIMAVFSTEIQTPVEPEYLDMLLKNKNYEEFARIMDIGSVDLVKPYPVDSEDPMFNKGLEQGDILPLRYKAEKTRRGTPVQDYPSAKWPGEVVYSISSVYSPRGRQMIENTLQFWNKIVKCVKWAPRKNESDYILIFPGSGCYSFMGAIGGTQSLSLQEPGCMKRGTILHEMNHAVGFQHEHTRSDRDDYIRILWDNIEEDWRDQYKKQQKNYITAGTKYDYLSVMHYPIISPRTHKQSFRILQKGVQERLVGQRLGFTDLDLKKISMLYCQ